MQELKNFGKGYVEAFAYMIDLPGTFRQMYEESYKAQPKLTLGKMVASKTQVEPDNLASILGLGAGAISGLGVLYATYGVPLVVAGAVDLWINN